MVSRLVVAVLISLVFASCTPAPAPVSASDPFAILAEAYADRDAVAAASAYAENGVVIYAYEGTPEERFEGRAAIEQSFQRFFDQFPASQSLALNFRFARRSADAASGIYQLRVGETEYYGSFDVSIRDGLFTRDVSSDGTTPAYEALPAQ